MDERKQKILQSIISDYISTAEPVGSRTLAKKYNLQVSPATIRNEMADLEELGFIEQPHTSAGRIPSDLGYRYYVDYLMEKRNVSEFEANVISTNFSVIKDLSNLIKQASMTLASLTNYTAVVFAPSMQERVAYQIKLIVLEKALVLIAIVMDDFTVQHVLVEVVQEVSQKDLDVLAGLVNQVLTNVPIGRLNAESIKKLYEYFGKVGKLLDAILDCLVEGSNKSKHKELAVDGIFNLMNQPEFRNVQKLRDLSDHLNRTENMADFLGKSLEARVNYSIGCENLNATMSHCSIVIAPYGINGRLLGSIGIVGPTRMPYEHVAAIVDAVSGSLAEKLAQILK